MLFEFGMWNAEVGIPRMEISDFRFRIADRISEAQGAKCDKRLQMTKDRWQIRED